MAKVELSEQIVGCWWTPNQYTAKPKSNRVFTLCFQNVKLKRPSVAVHGTVVFFFVRKKKEIDKKFLAKDSFLGFYARKIFLHKKRQHKK